ncbi:MAG: DUF4388 domain-containing protein, partial [Verrucomicrobiae bacterium]|nr:DUF4388 domain-containing protein [Verrucomicrobiae bacterium]
ALLNVGNVSFISRPVQVDGLMTTIRHLNETYMARAHFFTGTLYQITPIELIQLKLASQAKTLLAFTSTGRLVCVYIDKGRITGAMLFEQENDEYPKIVGREAIFELVKWPGGNFVETMGVDLPEECERLEESSGQLLLAALHVYDENVHQEDGESHSKDLKAI